MNLSPATTCVHTHPAEHDSIRPPPPVTTFTSHHHRHALRATQGTFREGKDFKQHVAKDKRAISKPTLNQSWRASLYDARYYEDGGAQGGAE